MGGLVEAGRLFTDSCLPCACRCLRVLRAAAGRKSCAITCATRLGSFLGDERIKDKVGGGVGVGCCGGGAGGQGYRAERTAMLTVEPM